MHSPSTRPAVDSRDFFPSARRVRFSFFAAAVVILIPWLAACSLRRPTLHAALVSRVQRPNGLIETRTLWADSKPLRVVLTRPGGRALTRTVELRAIHDGGRIGFLAFWHDSSANDLRRAWVWDSESRSYFLREWLTDFFAFKFALSGSPEACMMTGEEGLYDVWIWREAWSDLFGFAEDQLLEITRSPPTTLPYEVYASPDAARPIYLGWRPDGGLPPYTLIARPRRFEGQIVPGVKATPPLASAGDVAAQAVRQNDTWFLEVARPLKTGYEDDYQFEGRGPHLFSIALADNGERAEHFTSELIYLYLD